MSAKRAYHHGDLRRALLEASLNLLETEGVSALTMRRLASEVGVSRAAPSHHFQGKQGLLMAIAAEGFRRMRAAELEAKASAGEDLFEQLLATGRGYIRFGAEHPELFRIMFRGEHTGSDNPELKQATKAAYSVLKEATAAVSRNKEEAQTLALSSWALVHGMVTLWLDGPLGSTTGRSADELEETVEAVFQQFSNWLRASRERPPV